jgi:2-hydroxychromene-2-carboxylate isomerase
MLATPPRFYFNLRSPYSWLAQNDLLEQYPDVARAVQWRPFWEPDERSERLLDAAGGKFLYTPMSREKHFYILQDVRRLATDRGLPVSWPIDRSPRWEVAHLPYFLAKRAGVGQEYVAAVSMARWQLGRDISDPAVICELGAELGLDRRQLLESAEDTSLRQQGGEALLALQHDGVFGVPFFVVGRDKFWGVDRLPGFVAKVRDTLAAHQPVTATFDDGHAGGCG